MLWEIDIYPREGQPDRTAKGVLDQAADLGLGRAITVRAASGYLIQGRLTETEVQRIAQELLADRVVENFAIAKVGDEKLNKPLATHHARLVHVLPKPGVMDPVAQSALTAIADLDVKADAVRTFRKYWIYVPAQYDAAKPACVLVFQDGHRAQNTNGVIRLPVVMDNLIAKKEMPVTIGIFIAPGARGVEDYDYFNNRDANNRSAEYDSLGDKYAKFLLDEILPEVGKKYNLTKDPEGRAIGGFSSGAICAFNVAWERPDQFRKVISCIGSFTDIRGGHVYPQRILESEKKPIRVFIEDTLHDNPNPNSPKRDWHLQNIAMVDALKAKGYEMDFAFAEGTHADNHGGSIMPQMLKWLWLDHAK
jgi:enterochelin esterase family protein